MAQGYLTHFVLHEFDKFVLCSIMNKSLSVLLSQSFGGFERTVFSKLRINFPRNSTAGPLW